MRPPTLLLIVLTLAVGGVAAGSMWNDSATADEGAHIASGLLLIREGRLDFYRTQAPLVEIIVAAPLAAAGYRVPEEWRRYGNRPWLAGHILLYRGGYDAQRLLRIARTPVIALLLVLCFAVARFVRDATGNEWSALAAFAITGFCPTLLAHGRLATVDLGLTLFAFLAIALLLRHLRVPSRGLAVLTGAATACAVASKVSGALIVPFAGLTILLWWLRTRQRPEWLLTAAATAVVSFAAIYLLPGRSLDLVLPFRHYLSAVAEVREMYAGQYAWPQFLLGEFSHRGWPHYNLVAIAVKTPLPALLLMVLTVALAIRHKRFEAAICLLFAAFFLAASAFSNLNLGIRHVLPIYPFLYAGAGIVLAAAAAAAEAREARDTDRNLLSGVAALLVAGHVVTAAVTFPSYISYFNPLIGSHRNADRILIDSNLDWGQDLRRLAQWCREAGIQSIRIHYFGAGDVAYELGATGQRWRAPRRQPLPRGWFAVSRHFYRLSFDRARSPESYDAYLQRSKARYVTTIGGSIDIYRVDR